MKNLFKEIDKKGGYPVHKFINHILVFNLAFTLMDVMLAEDSTLLLNIDTVQTDMLRISVRTTTSAFNMASFTRFVDELTREDKAVKFFSLSANTLDKVFCRLIQDKNFDAY